MAEILLWRSFAKINTHIKATTVSVLSAVVMLESARLPPRFANTVDSDSSNVAAMIYKIHMEVILSYRHTKHYTLTE